MLNLIKSIYGLLQRVFFLLWYPDKLLKLAIKHTPDADPKTLKRNIDLVHAHVFRAFGFVMYTVIASGMVYLLFRYFNFSIGHKAQLMFRVFGYLCILCGILSPTGKIIETIGGKTIPEIVDEEWHRFAYMIGLFLLLLSYLFEME